MNDDGVTILPDGSGFAVASFPLPKNHWIYAPHPDGWDRERDTFIDAPQSVLDESYIPALIEALRYAIRGATLCGKVNDPDPDAIIQNTIYALCGPSMSRAVQGDATS